MGVWVHRCEVGVCAGVRWVGAQVRVGRKRRWVGAQV